VGETDRNLQRRVKTLQRLEKEFQKYVEDEKKRMKEEKRELLDELVALRRKLMERVTPLPDAIEGLIHRVAGAMVTEKVKVELDDYAITYVPREGIFWSDSPERVHLLVIDEEDLRELLRKTKMKRMKELLRYSLKLRKHVDTLFKKVWKDSIYFKVDTLDNTLETLIEGEKLLRELRKIDRRTLPLKQKIDELREEIIDKFSTEIALNSLGRDEDD